MRDLRFGNANAFPPMWSAAYGSGDQFAVEEVGTLKGVRWGPDQESIILTIEHQGNEPSGTLRVDVERGRILRLVENQEVWEDCLELRSEYRRLRRHVETVVSNNCSNNPWVSHPENRGN